MHLNIVCSHQWCIFFLVFLLFVLLFASHQQGKFEDFGNLVILLKLDQIIDFSYRVTLKFDGWPKSNRILLYYIKFCASFQSHQCIHTWAIIRKQSIRVKIGKFRSHVTLKFDARPSKSIEHLFYTISSFVHHFIGVSYGYFEMRWAACFNQGWIGLCIMLISMAGVINNNI